MSDISRSYTKALYGFDAIVQRVPAAQWDVDTPCEGWCVRDVVAHAAGILDSVAQMAQTGEVAMPAMPDPGDDVVALWNASRDNVLEAIDAEGAITRAGTYWFGEGTIEDILAFSQYDTLVHAWDLGRALGIDPHTSDDVAEMALAAVTPMADPLRGMNQFSDAIEVPADADAMTRLLGLTGRDPGS